MLHFSLTLLVSVSNAEVIRLPQTMDHTQPSMMASSLMQTPSEIMNDLKQLNEFHETRKRLLKASRWVLKTFGEPGSAPSRSGVEEEWVHHMNQNMRRVFTETGTADSEKSYIRKSLEKCENCRIENIDQLLANYDSVLLDMVTIPEQGWTPETTDSRAFWDQKYTLQFYFGSGIDLYDLTWVNTPTFQNLRKMKHILRSHRLNDPLVLDTIEREQEEIDIKKEARTLAGMSSPHARNVVNEALGIAQAYVHKTMRSNLLETFVKVQRALDNVVARHDLFYDADDNDFATEFMKSRKELNKLLTKYGHEKLIEDPPLQRMVENYQNQGNRAAKRRRVAQ